MAVYKTVSISMNQANFLEKNELSPSLVIQEAIDRLILKQAKPEDQEITRLSNELEARKAHLEALEREKERTLKMELEDMKIRGYEKLRDGNFRCLYCRTPYPNLFAIIDHCKRIPHLDDGKRTFYPYYLNIREVKEVGLEEALKIVKEAVKDA